MRGTVDYPRVTLLDARQGRGLRLLGEPQASQFLLRPLALPGGQHARRIPGWAYASEKLLSHILLDARLARGTHLHPSRALLLAVGSKQTLAQGSGHHAFSSAPSSVRAFATPRRATAS